MARPLRIEYRGAFYHVINRGQRREAIFDDDRDRERFLSCLARMSTLFRVRLHAYCLMTNHYHLILETSEANLSRAIQWLNVSYAVYYNQRHEYAGHVFQGRFKAILVEADSYLEPLSRYIHLNPVRVELVKQPWKYAWSSCRYFVTTETPPDWLDAQRVLMGFGRYGKTQRKRYRAYLLNSDPENPSLNAVGGLLLGSEAFSEWAKSTFLSPREEDRAMPVLEDLKTRPTVETIVKQVAKHYQVKSVDIRRRGRKGNLSRDVAIFLSRELSGHSGQDLGREFGKISGAAICVRCKHIVETLAANRKLKREIREIKAGILNI